LLSSAVKRLDGFSCPLSVKYAYPDRLPAGHILEQANSFVYLLLKKDHKNNVSPPREAARPCLPAAGKKRRGIGIIGNFGFMNPYWVHVVVLCYLRSSIESGGTLMRIVVKLGTSTLTNGTPYLSPPLLIELVRQVSQLQSAGRQAVLVSSGAIAAGRERLNFPQLPKDIPAKQMLAAVGQPRLMAMYERIFGLYNLMVAQVLLTRTDLAIRQRYLNARNTLIALMEQHVIPIVNENDTVATEEIRVGDNDNLSALVANLVDAELLILLTDQPGLYTADPRVNPDAKLMEEVTAREIAPEIWQAARGSIPGLGTGGMTTKLQAADLARRSGACCIIADGKEPNVLLRVAEGERLGTRFHPTATSVESRKRYILSALRAPGELSVDDGAAKALSRGASLLPVGVTGVDGEFDRGDTVRVVRPDGIEIARGIVNYDSHDLALIVRRPSDEIEPILGYHFGDEVIHRNDLVLL
jgi:glutamate 5-kinase